jgi:hypothetical protein
MGKTLNEGFFDNFQISTVGKLFLAGVAASILGKATNIKIKGTPDEIDILKRALLSSKAFQNELHRPGATVQSIMDKLQLAHVDADEFERILGVPWPL